MGVSYGHESLASPPIQKSNINCRRSYQLRNRMALQPSLRPLLIAGKPDAPHTLDIFRMSLFIPFFVKSLTFCGTSRLCLSFQVTVVSYTPILKIIAPALSRKLSVTIDRVVKPWVEAGGRYEGKIKVIFRNQVQPWHGASTFTHEAGLAVTIPGSSPDNSDRYMMYRLPASRQTNSGSFLCA